MATLSTGYTFTSGEVVTPAKLNNLVDQATSTLENSEVTTAKIADANVTTAKIADANVTTAKIADGAATTAKIADGAVTNAKLGNDIVLVPPGAVMPFAMNSAPSGWLIANGNVVPNGTGTVQGVTANFSALYAAVSNSFGPEGTLPDLRGYFIRGFGTNSDGTASAAFGVKQADSIIDHTHDYTDKGSGSIGNGLSGGTQASNNSSTTRTSLGVNAPNASGTETRPANIALLYCIKF